MSELPETPDLVVVCLPERYVLSAVEEALDRGTKAICVISAGFAGSVRRRERQDPCWSSSAPTAEGSSAPIVWESRSPHRA